MTAERALSLRGFDVNLLGDRAEDSFRQAMLISQGDLTVFFSNALVGGITALALVMLFWPLISRGIRSARGR